MKVIEKELNVVRKFVVNYENGIKCNCVTTNDKLTQFSFMNSKENLTYVKNIEELKNSHWSDHHKILLSQNSNSIFYTVDDILNFKDFDNLFYVGSSFDGMLKDRNDVFISTHIRLDSVFSQIYLKIETKKEKCQKIIDSLNKKYVTDYGIVEIPYYNCSENKKHHYTINLTLMLPDDLYNEFMKGKKSLDDNIKVKIFDFIKN
jgi:hypothetical protein